MSFEISANLIGVLTGAIAVASSAAMAAMSKRLYSLRGGEVEISLAKKRMCDPESETRVREARAVLARQENIAKWNKWADTSLTFSQYIVGGVLASSFIQSALAPELIGFLGVLVLASKLIHQHYRPDVSSRAAKHRATRLRQLIRTAEDGLYAIRSGQKSVPTLLAIRTRMSDGLSEIERAELQGLDGDNSGTGDNEPPSAAQAERHADASSEAAEA